MIEKERIIQTVEKYYGVKLSEMKESHVQRYPINVARNLTIYLLREYGECLIKDVAELFGMTVRNAFYHQSKASDELKAKGRLYSDYMEITKTLNK